MSNPLVSVIIPAYNVEAYIQECLDSISNQTYKNIEILVCNDGSTDNTLEILKNYRDGRIRIYNVVKNRGVSAARNILLKQAQGQYIVYQDSDDISYLNRIEVLVKYLNETDFVFVCTALKWLHNGKIFTYDENPRKVLKLQFMRYKALSHATSIFRRKIIDSGIKYDTNLLAGEDLLFEAEVQYKFPLKMRSLNQVLYIYRKRPDSLTNQKKKGILQISEELNTRDKRVIKILEPLYKEYCKEI
jgi:glycosyltransferase involved in cell wall biosynthesis